MDAETVGDMTLDLLNVLCIRFELAPPKLVSNLESAGGTGGCDDDEE